MKRKPLFLASFTFFTLTFLYTVFSAYKTSSTFLPDFSIFYASAQYLVKGISPYADPSLFTAFNYPLATSFLFIPFSFLSYQWSQIVFTVANILSVFCIVYLCFVLAKRKLSIPLFLIFVSFVFLSFPTKFTIGMGQTNILSYALLLSSFVFFDKKKQFLSVGFFVLAVLLKPLLGVTLLIFLFEKQWKFFLTVFLVRFFVFFLFRFFSDNPLQIQHCSISSRGKHSTDARSIITRGFSDVFPDWQKI